MNHIVIYTTSTCPFCASAKKLLDSKSVEYEEIDVSTASSRETMRMRTKGRNSVPQIFIRDEHIGGCDDLYALEDQNKLDALLH